jgi:hypothetical protein
MKIRSLFKTLPLAAMALVLTGCPHNEYIVQLQPHGSSVERTLVFFREDGEDEKTGVPNYKFFDSDELAAITALYPAHGRTNEGKRYTIRGEFSNAMPGDVGGSGVYTNLVTSLGETGFYMERFRGNDDLAGMAEKRNKAADRISDLFVGWSKLELGHEHGYDKLRQFLAVDFRRDLKNLSEYWWEGQLVNSYKTNATEEFFMRFGQYLFERGYFTLAEVPGLVRDASGTSDEDIFPLYRRVQRLVARKMGVPDSAPVPAALAFLYNEDSMNKSFEKYLVGTDLYRARLKLWKADKSRKPEDKPPPAMKIMEDAMDDLIDWQIMEMYEPDHLVVRLSLPTAPDHSNGRWDEARKEEVWDSTIQSGTNAVHLPVTCYASWMWANEEFQKAHLGRVGVTGGELMQYCTWRGCLDAQRGAEWDAFLAGMKPGGSWWRQLEAFRFSGETDPTGTNGPSARPRAILKGALE